MYKGKKYNIFICYRGREDRQGGLAGQLLFDKLKNMKYSAGNKSYKPFYANTILKEGVDDFRDASRQALEDGKVFILLLTQEFFAGCSHHDDMVKDEIQTALNNARIQFIPITLPGFDAKQEITEDVCKLFGVDFENRVMHKSPIAWNNTGKFEIERKLEEAIDEGFEKYDEAKDSKNTPAKDTVETDTRLTIKGGVLYKCGKGVQGDIIIPNGVTSINRRAFLGCDSLISVTIPDSVTSIGSSAFRNCTSLTSVTIPDSVTSIGRDAFYNCDSLTSVAVGNGVTSIGWGAFANCYSLTSVTIPDSVTSIGSDAFYDCGKLRYNEYGNALYLGNDENPYAVLIEAKNQSIASVNINASTKLINNYAFWNCDSLTSITIPDSVTSIGNYSFWYCTSLTSVTIPDSVTRIGSFAFASCANLKSLVIPESVKQIGNNAFAASGLTEITLPSGLNAISNALFYNCQSLASVIIGKGVTSIGDYAFYGCRLLASVTFDGTTKQWKAVRKGSSWKYNCPFTEVKCSDGVVPV